MHSVKRILTTENRTCAIRPTAIQSSGYTGCYNFKKLSSYFETQIFVKV